MEDKDFVRALLKYITETDLWMEAKTKYLPIIETDAALDKIINRILPLIGEEETTHLEDAISICEDAYSKLGIFFGLLLWTQVEHDLAEEKKGKLIKFNPNHPDDEKGKEETDGDI